VELTEEFVEKVEEEEATSQEILREFKFFVVVVKLGPENYSLLFSTYLVH